MGFPSANDNPFVPDIVVLAAVPVCLVREPCPPLDNVKLPEPVPGTPLNDEADRVHPAGAVNNTVISLTKKGLAPL